jgi:hypothetical protein
MTQGYESNHSGQFLESMVTREFSTRGFLFRTFDRDADNLDLFTPRVVVRNVPYTSLYKCESRSEFVITDHSRKIRVECRWQETSGSVDEKFPYLLDNAEFCMPESEILILLGGDGARKGAINYAKNRAAKCSRKKIWVLTVNDFPRWVREQFVIQKELQGA